MAALAAVRSGSVEERDPYWQIRAGLETLRGAPLSRPDSWSWAPVDAPFVQTSPGWNVILGAAWRVAGFAGFFLVSIVAIGALLSLLVILSRRLGAGPLTTLAGVVPVLLIALPFLSPRATVAAQALFLGGIVAADWWRRRATDHALLAGVAVVGAGTTAVVTAGSWLHLSWLILAPALAAACAVLWLATPRLGKGRIAGFSAAGGVGAFLGVMSGPYGLDAWPISRKVQAACSGLVSEWVGMFTPGMAVRWAVPGLLAVICTVVAVLWVARGWRQRAEDHRVGLVAALSVLALPASFGGFTAIRFIGVALLSLSPIVAMGVAHFARGVRSRLAEEPRGVFRSARVRFWADGHHWWTVLSLLLVVLSPGVVLLTLPLGRPLADMAVVERLPENCRLVSDPGSAAPVILLRPDVKVWIDGRADYYGGERNSQAIDVLTSGRSDSPPLEHATCVILRRDGQLDVKRLVEALDNDTRWSRLGADGPMIGWVRR